MNYTRLRPQTSNNGRNAASDMINEVKAHKSSSKQQNDLKAFLYELHLLRTGNTKIKQLLRSFGFDEYTLSHEIIHGLYALVTARKLRKKANSKYESYATYFEVHFHEVLTAITKSKIYRGYWIGNHCVDVFIPKHRVVIEIDGSVHNMEAKMRKDNFKEDYLEKTFKIYVVRIENFDVGSSMPLIRQLLHERRLNSKSINRLMIDVFISTICAHLTIEQIQPYVSPKLKEVFTEFLKTRCLLKKRRGEKC